MVGKCWGKMESWKDVWEGFIMTRPLWVLSRQEHGRLEIACDRGVTTPTASCCGCSGGGVCVIKWMNEAQTVICKMGIISWSFYED
jgi:hypothetical protein